MLGVLLILIYYYYYLLLLLFIVIIIVVITIVNINIIIIVTTDSPASKGPLDGHTDNRIWRHQLLTEWPWPLWGRDADEERLMRRGNCPSACSAGAPSVRHSRNAFKECHTCDNIVKKSKSMPRNSWLFTYFLRRVITCCHLFLGLFHL